MGKRTKDTPAGWGFVVVEGPTGQNHNEGTVWKNRAGESSLTPPAMDWRNIGSNNTGDSVLYYALEWAKKTQRRSIYSDSNYALNDLWQLETQHQ